MNTPDHRPEHHDGDSDAHSPVPVELGSELGGLAREFTDDDANQASVLTKAIGGWRGVIDSSVPLVVYTIAYIVTGNDLAISVWAAIIAGAAIAVWRLFRRQSLQQVLAGFFVVALSAALAWWTGEARNFFLLGLLYNAGYAAALVISIVLKWPAVGVVIGAVSGDLKGWRDDKPLYRACTVSTWLFVALFLVRLAVTLPLYLAGLVGLLGTMKLILGIPLFALVGLLSYRMIAPAYAAGKEARAQRAEQRKIEGSDNTRSAEK